MKSAHRGLPKPQQDDQKMACFASRASSPPFAPGGSRGPRVESSLLESSLPAQDPRSHRWGWGAGNRVLPLTPSQHKAGQTEVIPERLWIHSPIIQLTLSSIYSVS